MNDITFADIDPASVESAVISTYEGITQSTLYPGDPVRLFLEGLAYIIATQNNVIDLAGRQNLLAFAQQGHLDQVALQVGCTRLGTAAAQCVQRFTLKEPLAFAVLIPAGTRVTTNGARRVSPVGDMGGSAGGATPPMGNENSRITFATQSTLTIPAGELYAETLVHAQTAGSAANGFVAGQINRLIDPVAYITATENTTPTVFGADVESDAQFRARVQLAPEAYTCAGPTGAYRFHAMAAHQDIVDVAVWSPRPGSVDIRPVLKGGELPTAEILALVHKKLSADDVRPLTDTVTVGAPEPTPYALTVAWSLRNEDAPLSASIAKKVTAAVEEFRLWQRSAAGRDINPTKLIALIEGAGARRVVVTSPEYTKLSPWQIARESSVSVQFLGVEGE